MSLNWATPSSSLRNLPACSAEANTSSHTRHVQTAPMSRRTFSNFLMSFSYWLGLTPALHHTQGRLEFIQMYYSALGYPGACLMMNSYFNDHVIWSKCRYHTGCDPKAQMREARQGGQSHRKERLRSVFDTKNVFDCSCKLVLLLWKTCFVDRFSK